MTTKPTTDTARKPSVRLTPEQLIPTAEVTANGVATFAVRVRTGSQKETLTPDEARARADTLHAAADAIITIADRVERVNETDVDPQANVAAFTEAAGN